MASRAFYVIQHVPTGWFLPAGGKGLGGHTKQQPSDTRPPRLFATETAVRAAYVAYVAGEWRETFSTDFDSGHRESDGPSPKRGTQRKAADYKIRRLVLRWS